MSSSITAMSKRISVQSGSNIVRAIVKAGEGRYNRDNRCRILDAKDKISETVNGRTLE